MENLGESDFLLLIKSKVSTLNSLHATTIISAEKMIHSKHICSERDSHVCSQ